MEIPIKCHGQTYKDCCQTVVRTKSVENHVIQSLGEGVRNETFYTVSKPVVQVVNDTFMAVTTV